MARNRKPGERHALRLFNEACVAPAGFPRVGARANGRHRQQAGACKVQSAHKQFARGQTSPSWGATPLDQTCDCVQAPAQQDHRPPGAKQPHRQVAASSSPRIFSAPKAVQARALESGACLRCVIRRKCFAKGKYGEAPAWSAMGVGQNGSAARSGGTQRRRAAVENSVLRLQWASSQSGSFMGEARRALQMT